MKVAVFGANGRVGNLVVGILLEQGHMVRAFVHGSTQFTEHKNLEVIQGDIYSASEVSGAVAGSDAVVSTLGSWGTKNKDILSVGMRHIIPAMNAHGVSRIISLTGADADADGDRHSLLHYFSKTLFGLAAGKVLQDGEKHMELLAESGLEWTVIRSPVMRETGSKTFVLDRRRPSPWATINRHGVAAAMAMLVTSAKFTRAAPYIHRS